MNIIGEKLAAGAACPVILWKKGSALRRHPFISQLGAADRSFFQAVDRKLNHSESHISMLLLPSGRQAAIASVSAKKDFGQTESVSAIRSLILALKREKISHVAVLASDFAAGGENDAVELIAVQAALANFEFDVYKSRINEENEKNKIEKLSIISTIPQPRLNSVLEKAAVISGEINSARALSNTPGADMTPQRLAEAALAAGNSAGIYVNVYDEIKIKELGMGGLLGVSRGSSEKPRFIIMDYRGASRRDKPIVLIGKGVTFDTGGLNLKPSGHIYEMHMDMSGGAAVIHAVSAAARLGVKKNIIGLIPAVENMPSGSSYRPGDILKTMCGSTIEVLDTDAEGRIILADALCFAKTLKPKLVIDVATLTGAAIVALGTKASAVFATDSSLSEKIRSAGEAAHDRVWPLPLWREYEPRVKGTFGDFANVARDRFGGAIDGAVFLWQFIKGVPWAHIDIAPRMTSADGDYLAKGSTGAGTGLLIEFLRN